MSFKYSMDNAVKSVCQVSGTFTMTSTVLARIRESTKGALRNRIHDLVVRYNAKPIYEFEVSNFETAGGRVSKVYHSVKKSDVIGRNIADKAEMQSTWGSKQLKD